MSTQERIAISLSDSAVRSGIGRWGYECELEACARGHRIRVRSWNSLTKRVSVRPLTWRTAMDSILDTPEAWVGGMLERDLHSISVTGLPGWQADVLRMAICLPDGPAAREMYFLTRLSDQALLILANHGAGGARLRPSMLHPRTLALIRQLSMLFMHYGQEGLIDSCITDRKGRYALGTAKWLAVVQGAIVGHPGPGPTAQQVRRIKHSHALWRISLGPRPNGRSARLLLFRKWVDLSMASCLGDGHRSIDLMEFEPWLSVAEWIAGSFNETSELPTAALGDPELAASLVRFRDATSDFLAFAESLVPGVAFPGPRARVKAAAVRVASLRRRLLGI
jgi:hypothetical protein